MVTYYPYVCWGRRKQQTSRTQKMIESGKTTQYLCYGAQQIHGKLAHAKPERETKKTK